MTSMLFGAPELHRIIVYAHGATPKEEEKLEGVYFQGLRPPGREGNLQRRLFDEFKGKEITSQLLLSMKERVLKYYEQEGHPFVIVEIPEQEVTGGTVRLRLMESRLGKVEVQGDGWFGSHLYEKGIELETGDEIEVPTILSDIAFMNRSPFRFVQPAFSAGKEPGTTDLCLRVNDRFPVRFYAEGDNTGMQASSRNRWNGGVIWGNAFMVGHTMSYQYSTSSDVKSYQSHLITYAAPLRPREELLFYGGLAWVEPKLSRIQSGFKNFRSEAKNAEISARYNLPIMKLYGPRLQEILLGFDWKQTNNNLTYVGECVIPIISKTVNLTQFLGGYKCGLKYKRWQFSFEAMAIVSPLEILPDASDHSFSKLRQGAKSRYFYGVIRTQATFPLPFHFTFGTYVKGQWASENLLPSEQFGLGGCETVRGYEERELLFDNAVVIRAELRTPGLTLIKKCNDKLTLLGFLDYGTGYNHEKRSDEKPSTFLLGGGPGVRYSVSRYVSMRFDWGFKLHSLSFDDHLGAAKLHFAVEITH